MSFLLTAIVFSSAPFFWGQLFFGKTAYYLLIGVWYSGLIGLFLLGRNRSSSLDISSQLLGIIIVSLLATIVVAIAHYISGVETQISRHILGMLLKYFLVVILFFVSQKWRYDFAKSYIAIGSICCLFVVITSPLIIANIWPLGYSVVSDGTERSFYNYYLTFYSSSRNIGGIIVPRMSSYLDEPGAFGFFVALTIILNDIFLRNKYSRILCYAGGMLSFSLAFYIFAVTYNIGLLAIQKNRFRYFCIMFLVATGLSLLLLYSDAYGGMIELLMSRLEYDPLEGKFTGDNRFASSRWPESLFFGDGLVGGRDSIINEIGNIGMVGLFGSYLVLFVGIYNSIFRGGNDSKLYILAFMMILMMLLQRPVIDKLYILMPIFYIFLMQKVDARNS